MGRPSLREKRRGEVARALVRTLGTHGRSGTTIAAVATEAGIAPGLVHHYFTGKQDLYEEAMRGLLAEFRRRIDSVAAGDPLEAYITAALALDERSDVAAARAWVGIFAESLGDPVLFARVRRMMDGEVAHVESRGRGALSPKDASAVVAFVVGALVFGAFAPRKAAGFAAPSLRKLVRALTAKVAAVVTAVALLALLGLARPASAQPAQPSQPAAPAAISRLELAWDAPSPCPTQESLRAQVVGLLVGAPETGPAVRARGQVERAADGLWHLHFRLDVDGHEETRDLDAASCADLATATVTLVAIAVSPASAAAVTGGASTASEAPSSTSLSPQPVPPSARPVVTSSATTVRDHDRAGDGAATAPTAPRDPRFALSALVGGTTGAVGDPAFAMGASFAYLTAHTRWEAGLLWSPLTSVDNDAHSIGGVFTLGVIEARGCYTFPFHPSGRTWGVTVGPCVNAEGGYLYARGEGSSLAEVSGKTRGWAGVGAGGLLTVGGPVFAFRLQLEGVVPLANTHFVVDNGGGEVETPWPIVPRALVGGEVHFP